MINKLGAHFPVNDKYPNEYRKYKPDLPRGSFESVTLDMLGESFNGNWGENKNSYKNTVEWSLGYYFDVLLGTANLGNATVIYTSDHGQNFHERGEQGINTHCSSMGTPSIEEGLVPLVVLSGDSVLNSRWENGAKQSFNQTTHYNIFPTLFNTNGLRRKGRR